MQSLVPVYSRFNILKEHAADQDVPHTAQRSDCDIQVACIAASVLHPMPDMYMAFNKKKCALRNIIQIELQMEVAESKFWSKEGSILRCIALQYQFFVEFSQEMKILKKCSIPTYENFVTMHAYAFQNNMLREECYLSAKESRVEENTLIETLMEVRSALRSWCFRRYVGSCKQKLTDDPAFQGSLNRFSLSMQRMPQIIAS